MKPSHPPIPRGYELITAENLKSHVFEQSIESFPFVWGGKYLSDNGKAWCDFYSVYYRADGCYLFEGDPTIAPIKNAKKLAAK